VRDARGSAIALGTNAAHQGDTRPATSAGFNITELIPVLTLLVRRRLQELMAQAATAPLAIP
jgi:hypothetical protein